MSTYRQILLHVVTSTKHRHPWITTDLADRLYPYIGGIIRAHKGTLYAIGGVDDHVHLYLRWRPDESLSNLMREVKGASSKWIHESLPDLRDFAWQAGYAAFSVSRSQEPAVKAYIDRQREHHRKEDFKSELLRLLKAHAVEFDERYVFEWRDGCRFVRPPLRGGTSGEGIVPRVARRSASPFVAYPWLQPLTPSGSGNRFRGIPIDGRCPPGYAGRPE